LVPTPLASQHDHFFYLFLSCTKIAASEKKGMCRDVQKELARLNFRTKSYSIRPCRRQSADVESALEVASHLADVLVSDSPGRKQVLVADLHSRVTVTKTNLKISVRPTQLRALLSNRAAPSGGGESETDILLEAQFNSSAGSQQATKLLIDDGGGRRSEPDPVVVKSGCTGSRVVRATRVR
jgi:hypothetical protein